MSADDGSIIDLYSTSSDIAAQGVVSFASTTATKAGVTDPDEDAVSESQVLAESLDLSNDANNDDVVVIDVTEEERQGPS